jgi:aldehyde:ferredoxin oxidoreductase
MAEQETHGGYAGKILRVNLSNGNITIEKPDDKFYRRYLGGTALIGYYLLKELKPGIDPLGPENKLIFSAGVITGIPCGGCGRSAVGSKSPLTNGWGDAQGGGFWPAEMKRAGWDAIIVEGKADKPVYLWINDDQVEIRDAVHLWGKETKEVEVQIKNELKDEKIRVAQIGPAGEKLTRFASIANDLTHFYGRNGHGAVMGSKKLRAIAIRGHNPVKVNDTAGVREIVKWLSDNYMLYIGRYHDYGTAGGLPSLQEASILPTRNFREGQFEGWSEISGQRMAETILIDVDTCYACPVRCKRVVEVGPPYNVDPAYGGPEYETCAAFGSLCGISDLKAISKANQICAAHGLDTISCGVAIAFAMECFENGLLTQNDTGDVKLKFGNTEAMLKMTDMIAKREGLGNLLAEGTKRAAEKIGNGAAQYAMQVKGQELPMHEPKGKVGMGIGYALSPTGGDHMHNIHDVLFTTEGQGLMELANEWGIINPVPALEISPAKVRLFRYWVNWRHFQNSAIICMFPPFRPHHVAKLISSVTGWNMSVFELMKVGERALALARVFNAREGYTAEDDVIPDRIYQAFTSGPLKGKGIDKEAMQQALKTYYGMAGWDAEKAVPTTAKLQELGIGWVAEELSKSGL